MDKAIVVSPKKLSIELFCKFYWLMGLYWPTFYTVCWIKNAWHLFHPSRSELGMWKAWPKNLSMVYSQCFNSSIMLRLLNVIQHHFWNIVLVLKTWLWPIVNKKAKSDSCEDVRVVYNVAHVWIDTNYKQKTPTAIW